MGVHGLWKLIDSSGEQIPLESLENKIIAVDIAIWLHQVIKGFHDAKGSSIANAHLLGVYHRLCKLLYYKIRPVFVFDGGVPALKRQTIAKRNELKQQNENESERLHSQILANLLKQTAINATMGENLRKDLRESEKVSPVKRKTNDDDDMFKLPEKPIEPESDSDENDNFYGNNWFDLDMIDENSEKFKSLPADVRLDVLTELKEKSKHTSWRKLYQFKKDSGQFSQFQMNKLLKRRSLQVHLEEAEKEMGGHTLSLNDLEALLSSQGIVEASKSMANKKIVSNEHTTYLLIKDLQKSVKETKKNEELKKIDAQTLHGQAKKENENILEKLAVETEQKQQELNDLLRKLRENQIKNQSINKPDLNVSNKSEDQSVESEDLEMAIQLSLDCQKTDRKNTDSSRKKSECPKKSQFDSDLETAIKLSLECVDDQSQPTCTAYLSENIRQPQPKKSPFFQANNLHDNDFDSDSSDEGLFVYTCSQKPTLAVNYLTEYSDYTPAAIDRAFKCDDNSTKKCPNNVKSLQETYFMDEMKLNSPIEKKIERKVDRVEVISSSGSDSDFVEVDESFLMTKKPLDMKINTSIQTKTVDGIEVSSSGSDSDFVEVDECLPVLKKPLEMKINTSIQSKTVDGIEVGSSGSDSDFVEVDDRSQAEKSLEMKVKSTTGELIDSSSRSNSAVCPPDRMKLPLKSQSSLEIVVEPTFTLNPDDDLFADVFQETQFKSKSMKITVDNFVNDPIENVNKNTTMNTRNKTIEHLHANSSDIEILDENAPGENKNDESEKTIEAVEISVDNPSTPDDIETVTEKNSVILSDETSTNREIQTETLKKPEMFPKMTNEQLVEMRETLEKESDNLMQQAGQKERFALNLSEKIYQETQELLTLFGVPFIVAPMEAEAQCAFLEQINLTNGTITDDSDIWLFGGRTVYKNFFSQKKHVMQFRAEKIQEHLRLTRKELILLALLVGSDYTVGIQGVGPVTALEILAAFPPASNDRLHAQNGDEEFMISGLKNFRRWLRDDKLTTQKLALKNKLKNITITDSFPSTNVIRAYLEPEVDKSNETFEWGFPSVEKIYEYTRAKFGWSRAKSEEMLRPIVKRAREKTSQKTLMHYFNMNTGNKTAALLSKRVKNAVEKLGGVNVEEPPAKKVRKSRKKASLERIDEMKTSESNGELIKVTNVERKKAIKKKQEPQVVEEEIEIKPLVSLERKLKSIKPKVQEFIPQRERDKINALKTRLRAIEIYRKSKLGTGAKRKIKKTVVEEGGNLSESSGSE